MSATTTPISAADFATAIHDLPLASLHAKAAELRNSIFHMRRSNAQLEEFAAGGDAECAEAMAENEAVMGRMRERIALLRAEVEGRGMMWVGDEGEGEGVEEHEGEQQQQLPNGTGGAGGAGGSARAEEQEEGVHL